MSKSSISPIDRTLSGAATPEKSEPRSNGKEEVLYIPQSSTITGASPSDCLVSYSEHSSEWSSYPSAEMQLVYSIATADWAKDVLVKSLLTKTNITATDQCSETKYQLFKDQR